MFRDSGQNRSQNHKLVLVGLQGQYDSTRHFIEAIGVPAICKNLEVSMSSSFARKLVEEQRCLADVVLFKGAKERSKGEARS